MRARGSSRRRARVNGVEVRRPARSPRRGGGAPRCRGCARGLAARPATRRRGTAQCQCDAHHRACSGGLKSWRGGGHVWGLERRLGDAHRDGTTSMRARCEARRLGSGAGWSAGSRSVRSRPPQSTVRGGEVVRRGSERCRSEQACAARARGPRGGGVCVCGQWSFTRRGSGMGSEDGVGCTGRAATCGTASQYSRRLRCSVAARHSRLDGR